MVNISLQHERRILKAKKKQQSSLDKINMYQLIRRRYGDVGLSQLHSTVVNVCFGLLNILLLKLCNKCKSVAIRCMQL
ncbi:hypothetical protein T03_1161 [Trichinella britovi]|uniref:Uncharacterized protein n=1 Tax=Trichinella britovi TaxID=45882 RepID=A0A0V1CRY1_TRIBR|nr:hypothetical protein T03_1161 [Trichinella britovi]